MNVESSNIWRHLEKLRCENPRLNSTNPNGCLSEAERLKELNGGRGSVYYIGYFDTFRLCHAYYLPDLSKPDDIAQNQADNDFEGYPMLSVGEVVYFGFPIPKNVSASALIGLIQDHYFDLD